MKEISDKDSPIELPHFTGDRQLLIVGTGTVRLLRRVKGNCYPLTDSSGDVIEFESNEENGVMFNGEISNPSQFVRYLIECVDGEANYLVIE